MFVFYKLCIQIILAIVLLETAFNRFDQFNINYQDHKIKSLYNYVMIRLCDHIYNYIIDGIILQLCFYNTVTLYANQYMSMQLSK